MLPWIHITISGLDSYHDCSQQLSPIVKHLTIALSTILTVVVHAGPCSLTLLDAELKKTWPNNRTINILFHGHSVPAGYHVTPAVKPFESCPYLFQVLLKQRYPTAVINVFTTAIGGENSVAGAARFNADVLPRKPDLIFIDYALNDRSKTVAEVETAWRSMVSSAQAAGVPVVLLTPTGASDADLSNPTDPLTVRARLIRTVAADEDVLLADVSTAWLAELASGTPQAQLLSQGNHPNLQGHQIAADALYETFTVAICAPETILATSFPRDSSTSTYTTPDSLLTFTTANTFSGQGDFVGDSGGENLNAWDGSETLDIALSSGVQLTGFGLRWTRSDIIISGFTSDPGATIALVNGSAGSATWNAGTMTLTLDIPWDNGTLRDVSFSHPASSSGKTLNFSFTNSSPGWQAAFTSFTYIAGPPAPLVIDAIRINASNRVEVTASGLQEGVDYELLFAPDLRAPFTPIGSPVTGDSTGTGTFLDPVTDALASTNSFYQVGTSPL